MKNIIILTKMRSATTAKNREQFIEQDHSENPELQRSFRGHKGTIFSVDINPNL